jgi:hypothetical protein
MKRKLTGARVIAHVGRMGSYPRGSPQRLSAARSLRAYRHKTRRVPSAARAVGKIAKATRLALPTRGVHL